jgi:hypothetical protein
MGRNQSDIPERHRTTASYVFIRWALRLQGTDLIGRKSCIESCCNTCDFKRQRVAEHRQRLRRQGLRPIQVWVPDVRAPGFAAEAHRQSTLAAASAFEADDQDFVDAISSFDDDEGGE